MPLGSMVPAFMARMSAFPMTHATMPQIKQTTMPRMPRTRMTVARCGWRPEGAP